MKKRIKNILTLIVYGISKDFLIGAKFTQLVYEAGTPVMRLREEVELFHENDRAARQEI